MIEKVACLGDNESLLQVKK